MARAACMNLITIHGPLPSLANPAFRGEESVCDGMSECLSVYMRGTAKKRRGGRGRVAGEREEVERHFEWHEALQGWGQVWIALLSITLAIKRTIGGCFIRAVVSHSQSWDHHRPTGADSAERDNATGYGAKAKRQNLRMLIFLQTVRSARLSNC